MFYFIPSWYQSKRKWYHRTAYWYQLRQEMAFDDTVNQVKLFDDDPTEVALLVLNYQPQLRYFLHQQGLLGLDYWSFFDDIQNSHASSTKAIDFKELNWPKGVRFIYTAFAVVVKLAETELATVHFAQDGNLHSIIYKDQGQTSREYVFDDRGFLSSLLVYQEGKPHHQDYLNPHGVWQVREYFKGSQKGLAINPKADQHFKQSHYTCWEDLLCERLSLLKAHKLKADDKLIIAAHPQHNHLLLKLFPEQKKVLSFFGHRIAAGLLPHMLDSLAKAQLIVVDTQEKEAQLKGLMTRQLSQARPVLRVTPFDSRLRLGHSQNYKELEVYYFIDTIDETAYQASLMPLLAQLQKHKDMTLKIISFDLQRNQAAMRADLEELIATHFDQEAFYQSQAIGENQLEEQLVLSRIDLQWLSSEHEVIAALDRARLVLDLGEQPDLYTQIASISAGIPQINRVATDYVTHQKNGWILESLDDLDLAFDYYFTGLANWNRALVDTVQKMADYTSGQLLAQWKRYL
ncbi:accessory Sec system protein Asp1 [Streptococcus halichoeri]|uniref:accessory Sec system protein Asp1 n=1 Tax=Streptococcus halichoeri TaxID=254785 RepID=UPI00135BC3B5|nr:accessory Sec system protein Asp1 [Streptococcus halichoeri]